MRNGAKPKSRLGVHRASLGVSQAEAARQLKISHTWMQILEDYPDRVPAHLRAKFAALYQLPEEQAYTRPPSNLRRSFKVTPDKPRANRTTGSAQA